MPSVIIDEIPEEILRDLRRRALRDRRSLSQEVIHLLDLALRNPPPAEDAMADVVLAERQAEAWGRLAGAWESDQTLEEEIDGIYAARSGGREVEL